MTDSLLEGIADIVKAKVRAHKCNADRLHQINKSVEKPLDAVQIAQAYLSIQDLRKRLEFRGDPTMRAVQILLNDLLVCMILMDGNGNENFQQAITKAFGGTCLNRDQMSQLLQAFNKIKTCGQSRAEFDKNFGLSVQEVPLGLEAPRKKPHPYKDLNATEQDVIFKAFFACAKLPQEYSSNSSGRKGGRRRNRRNATKQGQAFSACAELPLTYGSNSSRRKGRKIRNRTKLSYKLDVLEGHLKGMQHELSLLKKQEQEQEQSKELQAASTSKIAEYNRAVALLLEAWNWEIHSTPGKPLSV